MRFLLGTHQPNWLEQLDVPLFVSHRRLARYKRMPRARTDWALDSGAFTELNLHGHFQMSGLSVAEHQHRTVANYLELRSQGPFIPVLQGWTLGDYERCTDLYADAGVDLSAAPVVGLGSVCRRQDTAEIGRIVTMLHGAGIACHGFGVKKKGVIRYGDLLTSADSLAWSYRARRDWPLPGCTHRSCTNCPHYALKWRRELLTWQDQLVLGAGT
jgi:hypothetical protein